MEKHLKHDDAKATAEASSSHDFATDRYGHERNGICAQTPGVRSLCSHVDVRVWLARGAGTVASFGAPAHASSAAAKVAAAPSGPATKEDIASMFDPTLQSGYSAPEPPKPVDPESESRVCARTVVGRAAREGRRDRACPSLCADANATLGAMRAGCAPRGMSSHAPYSGARVGRKGGGSGARHGG